MDGRIVVHGGSAHMDDLLSVCLVLAQEKDVLLVERRDPRPEELDDPAIWVLDVGMRHEPELRNFDHHQFPGGTRACTLSLLAEHFGLSADLERRGWYRALVTMDSLGPAVAAAELGCDTETLSALYGPIERWFRTEFSRLDSHAWGEEIFAMLRRIGRHVLGGIDKERRRLALLEEKAEWVEFADGRRLLLFLEQVPEAGSFIEVFQRDLGRRADVVVTWNRRSGGWAFRRGDDEGPFDFRRIGDEAAVSFVHASGFMAATSERIGRDEILRLVVKALGDGAGT